MKAAVVTFPGSNCDRDLALGLSRAGADVVRVWHKDADLPDSIDLVAIPGGFSFGDYLRCGAIAAQSPVAAAIRRHAERGGYVLGVCNGFQVMTELGLLPGALMRNAGLAFVCRDVGLTVATSDSAFTAAFRKGETVRFPVAHHDGNYRVGDDGLARLQAEDRIAFTYAEPVNGAEGGIAGVLSRNRRGLGIMPHPERAADPALGEAPGARMLEGLVGALVGA